MVLGSKAILMLDHCKALAGAAACEATRSGCLVSIAIVDDGGHLLLLERMDGAAPVTGQMAPAKARMAALVRREPKLLEDAVNQGRTALLSASMLDGMLEGGVPVMFESQCIGEVGISGARPEDDSRIAKAALAALPA